MAWLWNKFKRIVVKRIFNVKRKDTDMIECVLLEGAVLTARKKITKEKKYNQKDEKMNGKNTK